jgi:hypothetical protein
MRVVPIWLIVFWIIIILAPAILAYLIGWFFIILWINILIFFKNVNWKKDWNNYVKFGNYKIFR